MLYRDLEGITQYVKIELIREIHAKSTRTETKKKYIACMFAVMQLKRSLKSRSFLEGAH